MAAAAVLTQAGCALQRPDVAGEVAITAHRGSSIMAPENTLPAIELAIQQGADYIEVDVRLAGDGTLVLLHDRSLRRVTGIRRNVRNVSYQAIRDRPLEAGYGETVAERVPTLEEAIELVRGRAHLYLDVKYDPATPDLVPALVELLQREDMVEGTYVASTHRPLLRHVARLEPDLRLVLFANVGFEDFEQGELDAVALRHTQTTYEQVVEARRQGYELHVWTVNRRGRMASLIARGVDNIITDRPDVMAALLDERLQRDTSLADDLTEEEPALVDEPPPADVR